MKRIVFLVPDDTRPHVMERMDEVADECGLDPCWMEDNTADEQREQRALAAWHGE